ncbi:fucose permease [Saccharopolyspora erythraea NRRL 2338]|uniref:Major facilitator superfamily MFS_1 n=2 Tax=Saccharopolyspora erythraea TaxID=1836 RepID=A4FGB2_SACEN|nr:MFS transporter [Saccharopolyspora erythraea]EQD84866.1 MFS transporter [Saccharopolyspora erythraea D]PFG96791.1 fucose permease [Saccharopolyspora erythraea NRRL 2338]QRK87035.1 MFS transporter [Saccharopolyspora erythraea]CAM03087.1 major facilitator superfamily MFS_1 [Saccharopolyspora erythraea NRRL 2338]
MPTEVAAERRLFTPGGVVAACAGFALIGALQALYGPAIPALRADYGLGPAAAGLALSAHFVGGLLGVLLFHRAFGKHGNRLLLAASYAAMAVGILGFVLSPSWPLALVGALVAGLGYGGVDYGLNHLFALGFQRRGTAMLNVLNGFFGVGSVLGPAVLSVAGAENYAPVFAGFAVLAAVLVFALGGVGDRWQPEFHVEPAAPRSGALRRSLVMVVAFVVLYVLNVGVEAGVGGWEPTHLEFAGYSAESAALATAVFWLMMTVSRFLVVPLTLRLTEATIIAGCCAGMALCLGLAVVPALSPWAYAGVGLFIGPVFPTGLPWLYRSTPGAAGAGAHVVAASMVGGVLFPPLLGELIELWTPVSAPIALFGVNGLCLAVLWWIWRRTADLRRPRPGAQLDDRAKRTRGQG